jgi:hypothetical protein
MSAQVVLGELDEFRVLDTGYGMLDAGYGIRDAGYGIRDRQRYLKSFISSSIPYPASF